MVEPHPAKRLFTQGDDGRGHMSKVKCHNCEREIERVVTITQINGSQKTTVSLCKECASAMGFHNPLNQMPFPLAKILHSIIQQTLPPSQNETVTTAACPNCGLTFAQFSQQGRFGCGVCYNTFRPKLETIMRRIHGSSMHRGKLPHPHDDTLVGVRERERLEIEYRRAVDGEEFERAADLRDRLREIRAKVAQEESSAEKETP